MSDLERLVGGVVGRGEPHWEPQTIRSPHERRGRHGNGGVNGTPIGSSGQTDASGNFTLGNVTAFADDTVTVYVDGAAEAAEANGVLVYDGLGDISGVQLYEQHLTLTSNETPTTTLPRLATSDNSAIGDEDVFFDVDGSGDLTVCAVGICPDANLWVGATSTFIVATSTTPTVTAHDFIQNGTTTLGASTLALSGSWDNQNTVNVDTATVVLTATGTSETVNDAGGTLEFYNLTFGQGSGSATWQTLQPLDINGDLAVTHGTLDRGTSTITLAGSLSTGANGFWSGGATTTFDGSGTHSWSDANTTPQNVGSVVVDGSARTVTLGSTVEAATIIIGADDTLNAGGNYDVRVAGDFVNNNVFIPNTSRVVVVGSSTNADFTLGGSNLYALRASSSGGVVNFTESSVTLADNLEIATGTVNLPTTLLRIGGSLENTGGTFAHNNAEVRFTGGGAETIELRGTPFLNALYDVSFTGSGDWSFLDTNATTTNTWTQSNGNITFPSGQLTIGRDFTTSGSGSFDANGGEVHFQIKGRYRDDQRLCLSMTYA